MATSNIGKISAWQSRQFASRDVAGLPNSSGNQWQNLANELARRESTPISRGSNARKYMRGGSRYSGSGSGGMGSGTGMAGSSMGYSNLTEPTKLEVPDNPYEERIAQMATDRANPYRAGQDRLLGEADKLGRDWSSEMMDIANRTADRNEDARDARLGSLGMGELALATDVRADDLEARNRGVIEAQMAASERTRAGLATAQNMYSQAGEADRAEFRMTVNTLLNASDMFSETRKLQMGADRTNQSNRSQYEMTTGKKMNEGGGGSTFVSPRAGMRRA